ncbi:MBL fold metallo-hydrolase [Sorangium sp. So ce315]|uniref:MBL fold metallo-hydrolase n=1 Tax=Sorangium sp. So ce315 TaxID=3133299 RepID=UPI003F5E8044
MISPRSGDDPQENEMIWSRDVYVEVLPSAADSSMPIELVLQTILGDWMAAEFDAARCQRALVDAMKHHGLDERHFRPEAIERGERPATEGLLYPKNVGWKLIFTNLPDGSVRLIDIDDGALRIFADGVRRAAESGDAREFTGACGFLDAPLRALIEPPHRARVPRWQRFAGPGIHRREHASLAIQSSTTRVLIDPIYTNASMPCIPEAPLDEQRAWDAILISHGHLDHWHLPSLLHSAGHAPTPIIVPRVPRTSLLTQVDFAAALSLTGLSGRPSGWGERVTVGDIEIEVLPFYGEQPSPRAPGIEPDLRNWGNCYRLDTPEFSVIVLVDSGEDADGRMLDVVRASVARRGPVDVVLSCLRRLYCPFVEEGLPHYWATLPFGQLQALHGELEAGRLPSATVGPEGVVEICKAAGARYFLPYANGFAGVGREIPDIGWGNGEPSEADRLRFMRAAFEADAARTEVVAWSPGDFASLADRELRLRTPCA